MKRSALSGTFSMVAFDLDSGDFGVCSATYTLAVGASVIWAEPDIGALAVQGLTNAAFGCRCLKLLRDGLPAETVLESVLQGDILKDHRQIILIDRSGSVAAHTGSLTHFWRGHLIGDGYAIAGNMLTGPEVLDSMKVAYEYGGSIEDRLMRALEAGYGAGGDRRGTRSAALKVAKHIPLSDARPNIDLRVDYHDKPILELAKILSIYKREYVGE
ncbi:DUF1028 domain-containing protein [Candidatus Bathyarchaeota archaeon]|nr:DUF1028 domain-containing protein [Candidatus Bathyarchaeota archaeon]MBS7628537.1 DUF1028 domain-containing protein [Candidatus Bathyarchaeota archaeon]